MESFTDTAIILSQRAYMDKGFVVSVLTRNHGRHAGFAYKSALGGIEIGALVETSWEARVFDQLGAFKHFDSERNSAPLIIGNRLKLVLVQTLCATCDAVLPEREAHRDLFEATNAFIEQLPMIDDAIILGALYVRWELLILQSLGYGLDLAKCAATESTENLIYVSPKTGKAVSAEAGEAYKERLLKLPPFLRPDASFECNEQDIKDGLLLTQTFFEKWVMTHMSANLPSLRYTLPELLAHSAPR